MGLPSRRLVRLLLVGVSALVLAGCGGNGDGGGGDGALPEAAEIAPADASLFVSVDTDFAGEQWQQAEALLNRFPSGDKLLNALRRELGEEDLDFERDVQGAVGPELGLVFFDLSSDDPPVVLYTKPRDPAKFRALLAKSDDPVVTTEVEGWMVAAETQAELDRFTQGRERGALADEEAFQDAFADQDEDAMVSLFLGGQSFRTALGSELSGQLAVPGVAAELDKFRGASVTASTEPNGVRFDSLVAREGDLGLEDYEPALDEVLPAKPLFFFFSVANLDDPARQALEAARENIPNFDTQLGQFERALGLSLEDDLIGLFDGELAIGVYPESAGDLPVAVDVVLSVDDEAKAQRLMERLVALAELSDAGQGSNVTVAGLEAHELRFTGEDFSIFWAVFDGKLAVTTSRAALEALRGEKTRLADDPAYTDALAAAEVPDQVSVLVYSNLEIATPYLLDLADEEGEVESEVRQNLEPLRWAVIYGSGNRASGFVRIE